MNKEKTLFNPETDKLSGIITLRFLKKDRLKFEDIEIDQITQFSDLIDEKTHEKYEIQAKWSWKEEYPNSFVAKFEATLGDHPYLGEVHINQGRLDYDAILLQYNNLNE